MDRKLYTPENPDDCGALAPEDASPTHANCNAREVGGNRNLHPDELKMLLDERVNMMKAETSEEEITDQYRIYCNIIEGIERGSFTPMLVQGSAGTRKVSIFHFLRL